MPCYHPLPAWRSRAGQISIGKELPDSGGLLLPCGGCIGCRTSNAKAWALRCQLELQQHTRASFTTLTYDDQHLPPTLTKRHVQLWLKRLRKAMDTGRSLRYFASGEYGERYGRPHYHALLYGLDTNDRESIQTTWAMGHTYTEAITPARIAYVAGYTATKINDTRRYAGEWIDPETGEVFEWQLPFFLMSRRPGIGGHARQWINSWRITAIHNGQRQPVPRFLHEAWKQQATGDELYDLETEKIALTRNTTTEQRQAAELIAIARQSLQANRRKYE